MKLIGNPKVMRVCTKYGLPRKTLMRFTLKLLANLHDSRDGDAMDKLINACPGSRRRREQKHVGAATGNCRLAGKEMK